jgi:hypothetical protein
MQKLAITGALALYALAGTAVAQTAGNGQSADAANAASMPMQGTPQVLASPGAAAVEPRAYPLCSRTVTDECVNPRQAGRAYGNRPLDDWPGHPASESAE